MVGGGVSFGPDATDTAKSEWKFSQKTKEKAAL